MTNLSLEPISPSRTPLRGARLLLVRIAWVTLTLLILGLFIISVANRSLHTAPLATANQEALNQLGLSVKTFHIYNTILNSITLLFFFFTAVAIFWRKSDDWMAMLVSVALLTFAAAISPTLNVLIDPGHPLSMLIRGLGVGSSLIVFYLFPDGKFIPGWTRHLTYTWVVWLVAWGLFPTSAMEEKDIFLPVRMLYNLFSSDTNTLVYIYNHLRDYSLIVVVLGWFGSGVWAQLHRYRCAATPTQRQQTKWIVFGLTVAFLGYAVYQLPMILVPAIRTAGLTHVWWMLIGNPIYLLTLLLVPLFIAISILRYGLWDIDVLINRTLVYGALTALMGFLYFGAVILFQEISYLITHQSQPAIAIAITTLILAAIFSRVRQRVQNTIDRRFYREKVDFRQAFMDFSSRVRTMIELPELLSFLAERTTGLLHISHGAVFLYQPDETFQLAEARNLPEEITTLQLEPNQANNLKSGNIVSRPNDPVFPLIVPLLAPHRVEAGQEKPQLLGALSLGPRLSGLGYYREDGTLLSSLADQAGTAIYVARLIQEKQAETERLTEVERRLAAHRNSPLGRAEMFAQTIFGETTVHLQEFYRLAQTARQDASSAELLSNLPQVFESLGSTSNAHLAEGFVYVINSYRDPEMLPVGLRTITNQVEELQANGAILPDGKTMQALFQACYSAIQANTVPHISDWGTQVPNEQLQGDIHQHYPLLTQLTDALVELRVVVEALRAYERLDATQDRLTYLASAIERLSRLERKSRTELGSIDSIIVQRIAEKWLGVITSTMSELQSRAQIVCQLLTRHTWQGDVIAIALNVHNNGRSAALNLRVSLAASPDYTLLDEQTTIERLSPSEEKQVSLRVRPRLERGVDHFRARFVILYSDPRGADQVENYADVVQLISTASEFQFIPNPYVVGTPLQPGSPLFFGREDLITFVQENLAASHRNNLVLIGQRRTGKTSLLKQLPGRLGDEYLAVYLDGQSLGLDPGLPNFFLALATEIAFALEDRGFSIPSPELSSFKDSPAATFEHDFLARTRQQIGNRHMLLMLDEFEELESAVRRGDLEESIFNFIRHLIQHTNNLSVIFCGTHRLEELASDYWNVLFNISLYRHVAFLERGEAMRLVQEPVNASGMRYDDLALDKIWRVTAGHPYFLQLLCHSLVNHHNKGKRSYTTVADVNTALEEILSSGEAHFIYLWTESTPEERLALASMSRMIPLGGQVSTVQINDYLSERGVPIERQAIGEALHHLALRDVLTISGTGDASQSEEYAWKLGLLGLWVEKYKSMSRVIDEAYGKR